MFLEGEKRRSNTTYFFSSFAAENRQRYGIRGKQKNIFFSVYFNRGQGMSRVKWCDGLGQRMMKSQPI